MKTPTVLKWTLVGSIVIVLNLFFNYSIALIYEEPKWDDFCKQDQINVQPQTKEECVADGGQWNENASPRKVVTGEGVATQPVIETTSYCDQQFTCRQDFDDARESYTRNVFIVLVVLGVLSLVAGFYFASVPAVSLGLSLGGVLSLVIASMRYWGYMEGYLRVAVLGVALIALIWLGVKKIKE